MEPKKKRYDPARWEERYLEAHLPWDTGKPDIHLARFIDDFPMVPGRALDVGCGTGTNTLWLEQRGFETTGIDLAPTAIELAKAKAEAAGARCRLLCTDFLTGEVPGGPFQLVYDRGCFHTFDDPEVRARFAAGIARLLEPEGLWHSLMGSTDGPPREAGPPRRSAAEVITAVEPHFEILRWESKIWDEDRFDEVRAWVMVARRRAP